MSAQSTLLSRFRSLLGVQPHVHIEPIRSWPKGEHTMTTTMSNPTVEQIKEVHAAVANIYGEGFARKNPAVVAQFMQALATDKLATEVGAVRAMLEAGTGGINVALEHSA
jgi:hypothetical protein